MDHLGIRQIKTARRSPWQNGYAERFVGTHRRELLDHVIVLGKRHLRRLVQSHAACYNEDRSTWRSIGEQDEADEVAGSVPGLGLAIVNAIIQAHSGRIWVDSKLGSGSTFSLPARRDRGETDTY